MTATLTPKQTPSTDKQKATVALITRALHNNSAATAADIRATFGNILARLAEDSRPEGEEYGDAEAVAVAEAEADGDGNGGIRCMCLESAMLELK